MTDVTLGTQRSPLAVLRVMLGFNPESPTCKAWAEPMELLLLKFYFSA